MGFWSKYDYDFQFLVVAETEALWFHQELKASKRREIKRMKEIQEELKGLQGKPEDAEVIEIIGDEEIRVSVTVKARREFLEQQMKQCERHIKLVDETIEDITRVNKWGVRVYKV